MELINQIDETFNFENKEEVIQNKKEYYENNKETIIEKSKEYYQENKENVLDRTRQYYKENKEQILKYQSEKIECECGMKVQRNYLKKHTLSEIHKLSLENKLLGNPAKDCIKIECECGHSVRNNYLKRHLNSGIHKTAMHLKMESISKEPTE